MQPRSHHYTLCALVLALTVAGCAGPMGTIHPLPPPPPPVTAFDGSYRSTLLSNTPAQAGQVFSWCQSPGQAVITVDKGVFTYAVSHPNVPGNPTPVFQATVAPDGSFAGQAISGSVTGQITGPRLEGKLDGMGCVYSLTGNRI